MSAVCRKVRDAVLERDGHKCTSCGTKGNWDNPLQMHHVIYKCKGGLGTVQNLTTLCNDCHRLLHKLHPVGNRKRRHKIKPYKVYRKGKQNRRRRK